MLLVKKFLKFEGLINSDNSFNSTISNLSKLTLIFFIFRFAFIKDKKST